MSCPQWEMTRLSKMLLTSQCWFYIYLPWSNFTKVKMLSSQYVMLFWQWFDCCVTSGRSVASYVKIMWNFVWPLTLLLSAEKRLCWCCCKAGRDKPGEEKGGEWPSLSWLEDWGRVPDGRAAGWLPCRGLGGHGWVLQGGWERWGGLWVWSSRRTSQHWEERLLVVALACHGDPFLVPGELLLGLPKLPLWLGES